MKSHTKYFYWILLTILVYLTMFYYSGRNDFVLTQNILTGEVQPETHKGYHLTYPWILASKIDDRPHRFCIPSATRNMSCKLVKFDTSKWKDLIEYEGFHYYWWYNRFSFNSGQETYKGVDNLLFGHSWGNSRGRFVIILDSVN